MKYSGGELIVSALEDAGVTHGFGIPGTHNIELYDAIANSSRIESMLVTDEQCASFMADGYARASGKIAMLNLVPGAGVTHALSGIAEAFLDQVPMLVLVCGIRTDTGSAFQLHDIDQAALLKPITKSVFTPSTHEELYRMIREACELALFPAAGPVAVIVPADLYLFEATVAPNHLIYQTERSLPAIDPLRLNSIVRLLNNSKKIGIYAGAGCTNAAAELAILANKLDALIFTTISGKGVYPEHGNRWVWNAMGSILPKELLDFDTDLDCLLAIGCRFGEVATGSYGFSPPKHLIHIDIDSKVFHKNYPAEIVLEADAAQALQAIAACKQLKERPIDNERLSKLATAHRKVSQEQLATAQHAVESSLVAPINLMQECQKEFDDKTIYVTDSGNGMFLAMEQLRLSYPRSFLGPIDYSCMGYSVPAAIGAKIAAPERTVVAFAGDGAFLMTGMELIGATNYKTGVIVCVLHDGSYAQIAQFQERALQRKTLTDVMPLNLQLFAEACGAAYILLSNNAEIKETLKKAGEISKTGRSVLIDVKIDYAPSTYFTSGVVKTNFLRFPWKDRLRLVKRVIKRKVFNKFN